MWYDLEAPCPHDYQGEHTSPSWTSILQLTWKCGQEGAGYLVLNGILSPTIPSLHIDMVAQFIPVQCFSYLRNRHGNIWTMDWN